MKKLLLILLAVFVVQTADAQLIKDIFNKGKASAKQKVKDKADQKIKEGVDKVLDAPEKALEKKKDKKEPKEKDEVSSDKKESDSKVETETTSSVNEMEGDGAKTVIQTNILCEAGKKKVEALLKEQDGIFEVRVNIKNGELAIRYSSDGTSYTSLLTLINKQGFEADGNKPEKGAIANPCKK